MGYFFYGLAGKENKDCQNSIFAPGILFFAILIAQVFNFHSIWSLSLLIPHLLFPCLAHGGGGGISII
jgi:hypothetical protein